MSETCANCGASIGKLETPMIFDDHVVCGPCYLKLKPPPEVLDESDIVVAAPARRAQPVDPLEQLAASLPPTQVFAPVYAPQPSRITHQHYHHGEKKGRPLLWAGLFITLVSIPFFCLFFPVGVIFFAFGFMLMIVGAFM